MVNIISSGEAPRNVRVRVRLSAIVRLRSNVHDPKDAMKKSEERKKEIKDAGSGRPRWRRDRERETRSRMEIVRLGREGERGRGAGIKGSPKRHGNSI